VIVNHGYLCDYGWDLLAFFWVLMMYVRYVGRYTTSLDDRHTGNLTSEQRSRTPKETFLSRGTFTSLFGSRTQLSRVIRKADIAQMTGACTNRYTNRELTIAPFGNVNISMHDNI
jgi:hypothetical protein